MVARPRITKIKFLSVVNDLRAHPNESYSTIAERHYISTASVSKINRAVTWPNWKGHQVAKYSVQEAALRALRGLSKVERAAKAGLKPTPRPTRAEKELDRGLKDTVRFVTRAEFAELERNVVVLSSIYRQLSRKPLFHVLFGGTVRKAVADADESRGNA